MGHHRDEGVAGLHALGPRGLLHARLGGLVLEAADGAGGGDVREDAENGDAEYDELHAWAVGERRAESVKLGENSGSPRAESFIPERHRGFQRALWLTHPSDRVPGDRSRSG